MVVRADLMISPSSSSTRRKTPWVLGCCGPMFTVIVSVRSSAMPLVGRALHAIAFQVRAELRLADLERLVGLRRFPDLHGIILPLRVPFPVVGHQDAPQVGMVLEDDPEHVV